MADQKSGKVKRYSAIFAVAGVALFLFLLLGPPQLLAKSETPAFCGGCHVMEEQFAAWSHAGAHRRKQCVDCHLPNENAAAHYFWKSLDGMKDLAVFYSGRASEHIKISDRGAGVVQANCIRCHSSTVEFTGSDRKCWECHRRLSHRRTGAMATL